MMPPLSETFAGNSWRVEDRPGNPAGRFVVVGTSPFLAGAEAVICAVQYRPHAEAIAALPEMADALLGVKARGLPDRYLSDVELAESVDVAIAKAEGRSSINAKDL